MMANQGNPMGTMNQMDNNANMYNAGNNDYEIDPTAGMSVYTPKSGGTRISDIIKETVPSEQQVTPRAYNQKYKSTNSGRDIMEGYANNVSDESSRDISEYHDIQVLADDVNKSLAELEEEEKRKKKRNKQNKELVGVKYEPIEKENDYLRLFLEFVILLSVYVVMSQPFVITFASQFIYQLTPTDEGGISFTGILLYGIVLTILFMVVRKAIFMKL
jgi:hypothetical protein